jgi:hypothetical protein
MIRRKKKSRTTSLKKEGEKLSTACKALSLIIL